jgi:hypothetical protein
MNAVERGPLTKAARTIIYAVATRQHYRGEPWEARMNEKKTKQDEADRKSAETKGEAKSSKAVKNVPLIRMPSVAAVMLALSRRRITFPWQYIEDGGVKGLRRCGSSREIGQGDGGIR